MERRETEDLIRALREARHARRGIALATIVRVHGSAYRREGTRMAVREDGALTCMLSGGCLEPEVAEVASRVLRTGRPELRHYDLDEEVVWGLGLGCGGTVDVRIEPVDEAPALAAWLDLLERGQSGAEATRLDDLGVRLVVPEEGAPVGSLGDPALDAEVAGAARELFAQAAPHAETRRFETRTGPVEVFLDVAAPPPELVIFGAGHDAIPLAAQIQHLGWPVTIVDARAAFTTPERFPGARLVLSDPSQFASRVSLGRRTHVMVMNHHLDRDRAALAMALASPAPWIGVLGPRSRFERLLEALADEGLRPDAEALARVRNPVGLDIGAESPDEVALSVAAALIAERRGFRGGLLDGVTGRIHDPVR